MRKYLALNRRLLPLNALIIFVTVVFAGPDAAAHHTAQHQQQDPSQASVQVNATVDGGVLVQSSKDISNVVAEDCAGNHVKYDGLSGHSFTVPPVAVTVWVKSGANHSGDGPGYGERFDLSREICEEDQPSTTTTTTAAPTTTTTIPDGTTTTTSTTIEEPPTTTTSVPPTTTPTTTTKPDVPVPPAPSTPEPLDELPRTGNPTLLLAGLGGLLAAAGLAIRKATR